MPAHKPPEGPYDWYSVELCRCGFYHGSNRGRCYWCFNYYADVQLGNYLDWMIAHEWREKVVQHEARRILELHTSALIPR